MKTRRALQIIVGVLSLLVVAALIVATLGFVFFLFAREDAFPIGTEVSHAIYRGFYVSADRIGLSEDLAALIPALFYGLPCLLLFVAAVLLFVHKTPKQAKYIAGNILALTGVTIFTVFSLVFTFDIEAGNLMIPSTETEVVKAMIASLTTVQIALGGLLALFVLFVGLALGLKPKREVANEVSDDAATAVESESETQEIETVTVEETVEVTEQPEVNEEPVVSEEPVAEAAAPAEDTPATEYVPNTDVTVSDIVENTYGSSTENLSADTVAKINKLRALLDNNTISQAEYLKLVNLYLGKK